MRAKRLTVKLFFMTVLCGCAAQAVASDTPRLDYRSTGMLTGQLRDGTIIGKGRIMYQGAHSGFRVWSEASRRDEQSARYLLEGRQDVHNKLRVRLESDGGQADRKEGRGLVILTGDSSVFFNVVVDGGQKVSADYYPIDLRATALLP